MSVDNANSSSHPVVRRSSQNGHDRAYVKLGSRDIGYRDLTTGDVRCRQVKHVKAVATATEELWDQVQEALRSEYRPRHAAPEDAVPVPA